MQITEIINTIGQVATAIAVFVAIWAIWQNGEINRKQANIQAFLVYTERFERVMEALPAEACQARFDLEQTLPSESEDLTGAALRYLNLTAEEFYLWKRHYLDTQLWRIWEQEIQRMLRSPLMRREWPKLVTEFISYEEFVEYVRRVQRANDSKALPTDTPVHVAEKR
jgi:hypothetical protein